MKSFDELRLHPSTQKALSKMEFNIPTPIQAKAIPLVLTGQDLVGCAQTGTGKTGAFCIPMIEFLLENPRKTALVLAPTRELAQQIEAFWIKLTEFSPNLKGILLMGGDSMKKQLRLLASRPRVIIATPGRLLDHLGQRSANISETGILVLDEADRMLDMGFAPQLGQILRYLPKERQTLLFTATWEPATDQLARRYLRHGATKVSVGEISRAATTIKQSLVAVTTNVADNKPGNPLPHKNDALLDELNANPGSVLVFVRTKHRTDRIARFLESFGVSVNRLHGGRSQGQRRNALEGFKSGATRVLVATDIAARGLDVTDISMVINYDLPEVPEEYIHRIGRTGRAGATGQAISFVSHEDKEDWSNIAKLLKKTGSQVPEFSLIAKPRPQAAKRSQSEKQPSPSSSGSTETAKAQTISENQGATEPKLQNRPAHAKLQSKPKAKNQHRQHHQPSTKKDLNHPLPNQGKQAAGKNPNRNPDVREPIKPKNTRFQPRQAGR